MTFLADAFLHMLDPFAVRITDSFGLRWYGLSYAGGFIACWAAIKWMAHTGRSPVPERAVGDLMVYVIAGVLLGGRLGYVAFYDPSLLWTFTPEIPWWNLLAIHHGGMASHGGLLGAIIGMSIFARRHGIPMLHMSDLVGICAPTGLFLGRLANLVNGELRGQPLADQTEPPWWSIQYVRDVGGWAQEYQDELIVLVGGTQERLVPATIAAVKSGNEQVILYLREHLVAFHPSQLIQATTGGPLLLLAVVLLWWRPRRPGFVTGWGLIIFAIMRIASEILRQPDQGVDRILGLSRGQVLSVVMLVIGVVVLVFVHRRKSPPIGGLIVHGAR